MIKHIKTSTYLVTLILSITNSSPISSSESAKSIIFSVAKSEGSIYQYTINDAGYLKTDFNQWKTPYDISTKYSYPYINYNPEIQAVEVLGDIRDVENVNHWQILNLNQNSSFTNYRKVSDTFYTGSYYSSLAFVEGLGLVIFGGSLTNDDKNIVSSAEIVSFSTKLVSSSQIIESRTKTQDYQLQNMPYLVYKAAITTSSQTVFIAGGADSENSVGHLQSISFSDVQNFGDAQSRAWKVHTPLKLIGKLGTIQYFENYLFYNAVANSRSDSRNVEIYDLATDSSKISEDVLNFWSDMSAAYVSGGNWTIFGGDASSNSCLMESQYIGSFGKKWDCLDTSLLDSFSLQMSYVNVF